ncbi:hypothetical protein FWK35_00032457 [Aphis craccivora]|uniref:Uncharacterized protein n=1 Tax=Aphis craccivora TaxID=307492 RepID=A0A6G0YU56_APHCR|nr:hypothetical protein FWK35_00032457 [Aphis craccivora]
MHLNTRSNIEYGVLFGKPNAIVERRYKSLSLFGHKCIGKSKKVLRKLEIENASEVALDRDRERERERDESCSLHVPQ